MLPFCRPICMKSINVFIAGAKDLNTYRNAIKALGTDLNHSFRDEGKDIQINFSSYENFGNNQDCYNDFICKKADLVIFVLDGKIGDYTKNEYILSAKNRKKTNRPKIVVFLKSYKEITPDIAFINGMLASEDYYLDFNSEEDLKHKVKDYINKYVLNLRSNRRRLVWLKRMFWGTLFLVMMFLLSMFVARFCLKNSSEPVLLIAGGGSARNYIEQYHNLELEKYQHSYYIHLPSSSAWMMLIDEVVTPQKKPYYYPICVSASAATDIDFLKNTTKETFLKAGSIIEVNLGYDTLAVCLKADKFILKQLDPENYINGKISLDELARIVVKHDSLNVFTTSPGSGTKNTYEKLLRSKDVALNDHSFNQFSEYSDLPSVNKNNMPYVILGSMCYTVTDLRSSVTDGSALILKVVDSVENMETFSCKPINLYFMAYKHDSSSYLEVPQPIVALLQRLGCEFGKKIKDNKIKRWTDETVILKFEDLPTW